MTDHSAARATAAQRPPVTPSTALGGSASWTPRRDGAIAGLALLLMAATAVFANFIVLEGMITPGDPAATAGEIVDKEGTFRLGVLGWLTIAVLDVIVAWALYRVFHPVSPAVSALAAAFRLVYTAVLLVAVGQLLRALDVLTGESAAAGGSALDQVSEQAMLELSAFQDIYHLGLLLFGIHLALLGYLAVRSDFIPKVIGVLLAVAGAGYAFDTVGVVLALDLPFAVSGVTFLGELLLALWLLSAGARLRTAEVTGVAMRG